MFQYISCYSLSASAERITVLYPKFQYISCYSLSRKGMGYGTSGMRVSIHLMLLFIWLCLYKVSCGLMFQYISCYSLSVMAGTQGTFRTSFNTSHVTLYLILRGLDSLYRVRFNTSHVTLYRPSSGLEKCSQDRFNTSHVTLYLIALQLVLDVWSFQYISCYSLSLCSRKHK